MVIEVSARIVATTTLRLPDGGGRKIACCSAVGIRECSGWMCSCAPHRRFSSRFTDSVISAQPGMKIKIPPSSPCR